MAPTQPVATGEVSGNIAPASQVIAKTAIAPTMAADQTQKERAAAAPGNGSKVLSALCAEGSNALGTTIFDIKLNRQEASGGIAFSSHHASEAVMEIQQALLDYAQKNGKQKGIADAVRRNYKNAGGLTDEQALERFVDGVPGKATFDLVGQMAEEMKWPGIGTRNYKVFENTGTKCEPKDASVRVIPLGLLDQFRQYIELNCPKEPCPPATVIVPPAEPPTAPPMTPESTPVATELCPAGCLLAGFETTIRDFDPIKAGEFDKLLSFLDRNDPKELGTALTDYKNKHGHSFLWDLSSKTGASSEQVVAVAHKIYGASVPDDSQYPSELENAGQLFRLFRGYTNKAEERQAMQILISQEPKELKSLEAVYNEVYGSGTGRFANLRSLVKSELGVKFYKELFGETGATALPTAA